MVNRNLSALSEGTLRSLRGKKKFHAKSAKGYRSLPLFSVLAEYVLKKK